MTSLIDFAAWAGSPGLLAALAVLGFFVGDVLYTPVLVAADLINEITAG